MSKRNVKPKLPAVLAKIFELEQSIVDKIMRGQVLDDEKRDNAIRRLQKESELESEQILYRMNNCEDDFYKKPEVSATINDVMSVVEQRSEPETVVNPESLPVLVIQEPVLVPESMVAAEPEPVQEQEPEPVPESQPEPESNQVEGQPQITMEEVVQIAMQQPQIDQRVLEEYYEKYAGEVQQKMEQFSQSCEERMNTLVEQMDQRVNRLVENAIRPINVNLEKINKKPTEDAIIEKVDTFLMGKKKSLHSVESPMLKAFMNTRR